VKTRAGAEAARVASWPTYAARRGEHCPDQGSYKVTPKMPDTETLLRELNHRVKNNFQIIVSLMNLQKRMLPAGRREDIRFVEEHVQSMSVAYRLVYDTGSIVDVPLPELIIEVLSGLRQIAGLNDDQMLVEIPAIPASLSLDRGIALALYLAVLMPPYLDEAMVAMGIVTVTVGIAAKLVTLTARANCNGPVVFDVLRSRLMQAYAAQLGVETPRETRHGEQQIRFPLELP
jgi:hypothetical protein